MEMAFAFLVLAHVVHVVPCRPGLPKPLPASFKSKPNEIQPGSCGQTAFPIKEDPGLSYRGMGLHIVGGYEAEPHSMPWIVSIRRMDRLDANHTNYHWCGGSLIRVNDKDETDIILTAAHCFKKLANSSAVHVVAGSHNRDQPADGQERVIAEAIAIHEKYITEEFHDDIAIVKVNRPIKFTSTIQPICLPETNVLPPEGTAGIVAGWGDLEYRALNGSATLQKVTVPLILADSCREKYPVRNHDLRRLRQGPERFVQRDSGGPYFFSTERGYTVHGVVSHGRKCALPNAPGVYTRVTAFLNWIKKTIKKKVT